MKTVVISQRVDVIESYGEIRDALDEQWFKLFNEMGALLIPLPNMPETIPDILDKLSPDAIVLSGGNNPVEYGGSAPQRDATDKLLIQYSIKNNITLLGVCRGMQSIALYFGGTLKRVDGHVATHHMLDGKIKRNVNSFHSYAVDKLGEDLEIVAQTENGEIEAIRHLVYPIFGMMWHPERVDGFDAADKELLIEKLKLREND